MKNNCIIIIGILWRILSVKPIINSAGGKPVHRFMVILIGWKILKVIPNMRFGWSFHTNL